MALVMLQFPVRVLAGVKVTVVAPTKARAIVIGTEIRVVTGTVMVVALLIVVVLVRGTGTLVAIALAI